MYLAIKIFNWKIKANYLYLQHNYSLTFKILFSFNPKTCVFIFLQGAYLKQIVTLLTNEEKSIWTNSGDSIYTFWLNIFVRWSIWVIPVPTTEWSDDHMIIRCIINVIPWKNLSGRTVDDQTIYSIGHIRTKVFIHSFSFNWTSMP